VALSQAGGRRALGGVLAAAFVFALAAPAGAFAAEPLRPDLVTMRLEPGDLVVTHDGKETQLELSNRLANKGRGPLEIFASATSNNCDGNPSNDDRDAFQRVFQDANGDGVFERGTDTGSQVIKFGCDRYDPAAGQWDIFDLARYKLRRLHHRRVLAKSTKVAFCTIDGVHSFPGMPGSPPDRYYPTHGCEPSSTLGVSVGWADEYYYGLPGQQLDVTGVSPGRYCLISTGDPHNLLRESDNANNTRKTPIRLNPAKQTASALKGGCRLRRR